MFFLTSFQANQPVFPPPPSQQPQPASSAPSGPSLNPPRPPSGGGETLSPELFTGIVQGVLSTMMGSLGAGQGNSESIAQFIQRLSQTSNLFTPGAGDAVGEWVVVKFRHAPWYVCILPTLLKRIMSIIYHSYFLCLCDRILWRFAVSGVSEFLHGGYGGVAAWQPSASESYPARTRYLLQRALSQWTRAYWCQYCCKTRICRLLWFSCGEAIFTIPLAS